MKNLPFPKAINAALLQLAQQEKIPLEGYLAWLAEREGPCLLGQKAVKDSFAALYKQACTQEQQALPQHIVNAGKIYQQLTSNELGIEDALIHMESMCVPVAVYLLFAGEGYHAEKYKRKAVAYCKMFPTVVASLPEPYCEIGKALANDTSG